MTQITDVDVRRAKEFDFGVWHDPRNGELTKDQKVLEMLAAHREAAFLAGAEAMREKAAKALWEKRRHLSARDCAMIQAIDPETLLAEHEGKK